MSKYPILDAVPLPPNMRGKHGHSVGGVTDEQFRQFVDELSANPSLSKRQAFRQVIDERNVYFDAKYQTAIRRLRNS